MVLRSPNLDDRTFEQLVEAARARIAATAPEWTDLSVGDPGMALVEAFAYLADTMIYRLNLVPDKLFVEFLRLIGVRLWPPSAAKVMLRFSRDGKTSSAIEIPRGTRVSTSEGGAGSNAPTFATIEHAILSADASSVDVPAVNAESITAELGGLGTGLPGSWLRLAKPPTIAPTGDPLDLLVGVEAAEGELAEGDPAIEWQHRTYRIWREVEAFSDLGPQDQVFVADRSAGIITFAPAVYLAAAGGEGRHARTSLGAAPPAGREIRFWYRRGGGIAGNVAAGTLSRLRDTIAGVSVTNPAPATGGRSAETLENALLRGPQELRALSRAISARDYQLVAEHSPAGIARARAFTQAALWAYAVPGTVELVIVPSLPQPGGEASVTAEQLHGLETELARRQVTEAIAARQALATSCVVEWARYKRVRVNATVIVQREEDVEAVRRRVDERVRLTVNPLPTERSAEGWPFGQSLFASSVYKIILAEPGVRYARGIRLIVDEVPDREVHDVAVDAFQAMTWYAGSANRLFRTLNDGEGWELMATFDGDSVHVVRTSPVQPGLLAVAVLLADGQGSTVHVSRDSGATWPFSRQFGFNVEDIAWSTSDGEPLLFMATSGGLHQLSVDADATAVPLLVDPANQDMAFWSVVVIHEERGGTSVAVAAQEKAGIYLSDRGGATGTFGLIGQVGEDVRTLAVQRDGPRRFLWAGTAAPGGPTEPGHGVFRREVLGAQAQDWDHFDKAWTAGTCWALAFRGSTVLAATQQVGIMTFDLAASKPAWSAPTVQSGLPLRDRNRFHPVEAVAADRDGRRALLGGPAGVYRTIDAAATSPASAPSQELPTYENCSNAAFQEEVTLPPTWLFTCEEGEIEVLSDASA